MYECRIFRQGNADGLGYTVGYGGKECGEGADGCCYKRMAVKGNGRFVTDYELEKLSVDMQR